MKKEMKNEKIKMKNDMGGRILIKNGRIIDPKNNVDITGDIYIEDDKITNGFDGEPDITIDADGLWVVPGLIDLHVHLREPGSEYKETIATGTLAAAAGGFTTICCMPNTEPVVDNEILVEYIKMKAEREGIVNVFPIGSVSKGQLGEELANIGGMAKAGAVAISEDGKSVKNAGLLKTAMKYAGMFGIPVFSHCEDKNLVGNGQMNAGRRASTLGLTGISNDSEEVIVARDIILASSANARLHICHASTEGTVELLREALESGKCVTAEVTPHHFTLTDEDINDYDANFKMSPPLRSAADVDALKKALADDIIQVIATDHAPHHSDDKNCEFERAANGVIGLETALPLCITELVKTGVLSPMKLIEKLTINPAIIIGKDGVKGHLSEGADADVTIIDPDAEYAIDKSQFKSKSRNTPFDGRDVCGRVMYTIVGGKIRYNYEG